MIVINLTGYLRNDVREELDRVWEVCDTAAVRLASLQAELREAEERGDTGRAAPLRADAETIARYLGWLTAREARLRARLAFLDGSPEGVAPRRMG